MNIQELFTHRVRPYMPHVLRVARKHTHDPEKVQDVLQDALLSAWEYYPTYKDDNFQAWLSRIVKHTAINTRIHWYSMCRTTMAEGASFDDPDPAKCAVVPMHENPESLAIAQETAQQITAIIGECSPAQQEVFYLSTYTEATEAEIAQKLGSTIGACAQLRARAKTKVLQEIGE